MLMRSGLRVAFSNSLVNLLSLANGAIFIALLSRLVSVDNFAAWNWINSAVNMLCISDFYLILFLQNLITRDFTRGRKKFANFVYSSMFIIQIGFAVIISLVFIGIDKSVNLNTIFNVGDEKIWNLFELALISQLVSQGLGIFGAYFSGKGDIDISNFLLVCKGIAQNFLLIIGLWIGLGFIISARVFYIIGPLLLLLFHFYVVSIHSFGKFKLKLSHFGWIFFYLWRRAHIVRWGVLRILNAIRDNIPLVFGYFVLSSVSIADYALIAKFNTVALTAATGLFSSFVPRILSHQIKHNQKDSQKIISQIFICTIVFGVIYIVAMLLFAQGIISIWAGRQIKYEAFYTFVIAFSGVVQVFQNMLWNIFLGLQWISKLLLTSFVSCITICVALGLMIYSLGPYALPLSLLIGGLVFSILSIIFLKGKFTLFIEKSIN